MKKSKAEELQAWLQTWYSTLGFKIQIHKPAISDDEFDHREEAGQALFYRPATSEVSYKAFMRAVEGEHWTAVYERDGIAYELATKGYWYWAEVSPMCPRMGQSWHELNGSIRLPSLEEYAIVWHARKAATGQMLDRPTWCWLRTRCGEGAIYASGRDGRVSVCGWGAGFLLIPIGLGGGRAVEVI